MCGPAGAYSKSKRARTVSRVHTRTAGRIPDLDALPLDVAGVPTEDGRLNLNEYLQSVSNPKIYAAGDAASRGPPLTPVSSHDALAIRHGLTAADLKTTIFAYPTGASDLGDML
ncbi:MAG: hypothetical protein NVSMB10_12090 [Steroidobacteraceae bacterium]